MVWDEIYICITWSLCLETVCIKGSDWHPNHRMYRSAKVNKTKHAVGRGVMSQHYYTRAKNRRSLWRSTGSGSYINTDESPVRLIPAITTSRGSIIFMKHVLTRHKGDTPCWLPQTRIKLTYLPCKRQLLNCLTTLLQMILVQLVKKVREFNKHL